MFVGNAGSPSGQFRTALRTKSLGLAYLVPGSEWIEWAVAAVGGRPRGAQKSFGAARLRLFLAGGRGRRSNRHRGGIQPPSPPVPGRDSGDTFRPRNRKPRISGAFTEAPTGIEPV